MAKQQVVQRMAKGLYPSYNPHVSPEGALVEAENVFVDKENVITKARGMDRYGDELSNPPSQLFEFKDKIVALDGTTLKYDSDGAGTWSSWSGSFSAPATGHKIRGVEVQGSLYFTEEDYVWKNDALANDPVQSGVPTAYAVFSYPQTTGTTWLADEQYVAYKYVFVREDDNGRLSYGEPSTRHVVYNSQGAEARVLVNFVKNLSDVDSDTDWVYLFRTKAAASVAALGERYYLVKKQRVTDSGYGENWYDELDEAFLGYYHELYTNDTVEGAAAANRRPPHCKDIALYKGHTFYINFRQPHEVVIRNIEVLSHLDEITITRGSDTATFQARTDTDATDYHFFISSQFSGAALIRDTMERFAYEVCAVHAEYGEPWTARYEPGVGDEVGRVVIRATDYSTDSFTVSAANATVGAKFDPDIYNSGTTLAVSTQDAPANGLMYSKFEQPDAVPVGNVAYAGSKDNEIVRGIALKEALILLTEKGVYKLSGDTEWDFRIDSLDSSASIDAPESAVIMNDGIFCSSDQGVIRIDELGVSIISRQIEEELRQVQAFSDYSTIAYGCAYESERKYYLWVPESSTDTYPTIARVYDYVGNEWTTRRKKVGCSLVSQSANKMYYGHAVDSYVLEERKSLSGNDDFVDEYIDVTVTSTSTTTDANGDTVSTVTLTYSYTGATLSTGWLFVYTTEEAIVTAIDDLGGGSYTLTLSDELTLPSGGTPSSTPGWFDLLSLSGPHPVGSAGGSFTAQLGIPIDSIVTWAEEAAGTPGVLKHFTQFQLECARNDAHEQELAFVNNFQGDRGYVDNIFTVATPGWGTGGWHGGPWDSEDVPAAPVATYVPKDLQRCYWIRPTFRHRTAKERFDILSMSMVYRMTGERGVK